MQYDGTKYLVKINIFSLFKDTLGLRKFRCVYFGKLYYIACFWSDNVHNLPSKKTVIPWWRHQMETFSALLALCAGNSPVPVKSPHKGQWRRAFMFSLICAWINDWVNNREAGDLRRHRGHYDVNVMLCERVNAVTGQTTCRAASRFAPSQWETALLCNDVFHLLGANLESTLKRRGLTLSEFRMWALCVHSVGRSFFLFESQSSKVGSLAWTNKSWSLFREPPRPRAWVRFALRYC